MESSRARFCGLGEAGKGQVEGGGGLELAGQLNGGGEVAEALQAGEDLGVFKDGEGLGIHNEGNYKRRE